MDDKSIEKLLKKSKLASAYAMLPSPELRRAIAIEYGRLLGENDLSDPMLAGHLRTSILPAVAFHRCLQEYGYTQSASGMMRMQSNGTAAPACMSMCFADTVCRSWHPFSAKVMM